MNENFGTIPEEYKARAKAFLLGDDSSYSTKNNSVTVTIERDDSHVDGFVRLSIDSEWAFAEDALELSAFFKRLAKTLNKRNSEI